MFAEFSSSANCSLKGLILLDPYFGVSCRFRFFKAYVTLKRYFHVRLWLMEDGPGICPKESRQRHQIYYLRSKGPSKLEGFGESWLPFSVHSQKKNRLMPVSLEQIPRAMPFQWLCGISSTADAP